jgi:hypothetical protein
VSKQLITLIILSALPALYNMLASTILTVITKLKAKNAVVKLLEEEKLRKGNTDGVVALASRTSVTKPLPKKCGKCGKKGHTTSQHRDNWQPSQQRSNNNSGQSSNSSQGSSGQGQSGKKKKKQQLKDSGGSHQHAHTVNTMGSNGISLSLYALSVTLKSVNTPIKGGPGNPLAGLMDEFVPMGQRKALNHYEPQDIKILIDTGASSSITPQRFHRIRSILQS